MEDELRISPGSKRAVLGICCLIMVGVIAAKEKEIPLDEGVILIIILCLMGAGLLALVLGCGETYKVDKKGITVYLKNSGIFTPWTDCIYLGVEKEVLWSIVCIRRQGGCALQIPYNKKIFERLRQYAPESIVDCTLPDRQKQKNKKTSAIVLRDIEGEWLIDNGRSLDEEKKIIIPAMLFMIFFCFILGVITMCGGASIKEAFLPSAGMIAFFVLLTYVLYELEGKQIIIDREGIRKKSCFTHKMLFFSWQSFERIGVKHVESRYVNAFYIICSC